MNENLGKMRELGQAPWVDELSRDDTRNGGLQAMIDDGIVGVTSNPAIFQKAVAGSDLYDDQLQELAENTDDPKEMFWGSPATTSRTPATSWRPSTRVRRRRRLRLAEVQPDIAYDTQATIDEATKLHGMVDRPNLLIKIPATLPGLVAVEEMISRGNSINVTLIFSLERYREVARAYIRGIQSARRGRRQPLRRRSVASFFVSRIDAEADGRLEKLGRDDLKGKLAIANAKLAYRLSGQVFSGSGWRSLEEKGATRQRPLWASTSTKNPDYPDTIYVDNLVGPETVNTMPT